MSVLGTTGRQLVTDLVVRTANRRSDHTALIYGDRAWSYGELIAEATALAQGLRRLGVSPGDRVATLGFNSDRYVFAWLAVHLVGAIHVPINYMLSAGEVHYILASSGARVVLGDADLAAVVNEARIDTAVTTVGALEGDMPDGWVAYSDLLDHGAVLPDVPTDPRSTAQIAYTSGTESAPKGAMLSHQALIAQYTSCIVAGAYKEGDVVLHALPLYHCAQMHCFLMPYLWLGATNILLRRADASVMIEAVAEHSVTSIFAPPTVWIGILRSTGFDPARVGSLTKGYYGASIMPVEVVRELLDQLPSLALYNYYGQTELCPLATCLQPEDQLRKAGSAGVPVLNVETMVVADDMSPVAPGEVGEIVHRSSQLLSGYYNDEAKTAEAFAGGWFHSGDLATVDEEGFITIVDRKKDVINTGGENVSSREVEEALYQHPAVSEVAVVAIPDPKWIEAVCAVVVRRVGEAVEEEDLVRFAKERMAAFKVPKRIVFVDALPKNPSGKILKRDLREQLANAAAGIPG